ncbi:hypothetical protein ACIB24_22505 [Spongisporangium articulatum]|uniref:Uncharacterized protein n=1 Tax=Spongisporangium articulatum TaxID=3362603 RepID=A0ABW8AVF3_9ACTN
MAEGPKDYLYGQDESVKLTNVKSENDVKPLEGYPLDLRPDQNWPGLKSPAGSMYIDTDAVEQISNWLLTQLDAITRALTLAKDAGGASFGPTSWHEANQLATASLIVAQTVSDYTRSLRESIQVASKSVAGASETVRLADGTSEQDMSNVESNIGGGSAQPSANSLWNQ